LDCELWLVSLEWSQLHHSISISNASSSLFTIVNFCIVRMRGDRNRRKGYSVGETRRGARRRVKRFVLFGKSAVLLQAPEWEVWLSSLSPNFHVVVSVSQPSRSVVRCGFINPGFSSLEITVSCCRYYHLCQYFNWVPSLAHYKLKPECKRCIQSLRRHIEQWQVEITSTIEILWCVILAFIFLPSIV
jgi:hypothetical protein